MSNFGDGNALQQSLGITKGHKNIKLILQEFNRTKFGAFRWRF